MDQDVRRLVTCGLILATVELGAVARRRIPEKLAAGLGLLVRVEALLALGLDDPEVNVGARGELWIE